MIFTRPQTRLWSFSIIELTFDHFRLLRVKVLIAPIRIAKHFTDLVIITEEET